MSMVPGQYKTAFFLARGIEKESFRRDRKRGKFKSDEMCHIRICMVPTCKRRTDEPGIQFYLIPRTNIEVRCHWEVALSTPKKQFVLPGHGVICEHHFEPDQIKTKKSGKPGLHIGRLCFCAFDISLTAHQREI